MAFGKFVRVTLPSLYLSVCPSKVYLQSSQSQAKCSQALVWELYALIVASSTWPCCGWFHIWFHSKPTLLCTNLKLEIHKSVCNLFLQHEHHCYRWVLGTLMISANGGLNQQCIMVHPFYSSVLLFYFVLQWSTGFCLASIYVARKEITDFFSQKWVL